MGGRLRRQLPASLWRSAQADGDKRLIFCDERGSPGPAVRSNRSRPDLLHQGETLTKEKDHEEKEGAAKKCPPGVIAIPNLIAFARCAQRFEGRRLVPDLHYHRQNFLLRICYAAPFALAAVAGAAEKLEPPAATPSNPRYTGSPFVRTWLADDYGASPENSCVLQHPPFAVR